MLDKTQADVCGYSGQNKEINGLVHSPEPSKGKSDNARLTGKFAEALDLVVCEFHAAGLHTSFMAEVLARKAKAERELGDAVDRLSRP